MAQLQTRQESPFRTLQSSINELFNDFGTGFRPVEFSPDADIAETDKEITVKVDLPGLDELKAAIEAANAALRQIQASAENTSTLATQARAVAARAAPKVETQFQCELRYTECFENPTGGFSPRPSFCLREGVEPTEISPISKSFFFVGGSLTRSTTILLSLSTMSRGVFAGA